jgi:hypothetical protein
MCIGPSRLVEAAVSLSFDYNLITKPDVTYLITPYPKNLIEKTFKEFELEIDNYQILDDLYFSKHYDLGRWWQDNWYKQQAIKLCALDHFDSDYFLIQDCDAILLKPYNMIVDDILNLKTERLWNDQHTLYADMVEKIIGLKRGIKFSLVNELMPYTKKDWQDLKHLIEERNGCNFLDAIANVRPFDETKWFSEYELLGIYKTNQPDGWRHYVSPSQPVINTWENCYSAQWSVHHAIKFQISPLKFMNEADAKQLIKFFKNDTDN